MRFFRGSEAAYEAVRSLLDVANAFPSNVAATSIEPAATAPRDADSLVYVAISDNGMSEIAAKMMDEIDEDTYRGVLPQVP